MRGIRSGDRDARMKRLFFLLSLLLLSLPASAEGLAGIVTLARDDLAALAQVKATPERHVVLYFGDHIN
jgi:hypothetical protein